MVVILDGNGADPITVRDWTQLEVDFDLDTQPVIEITTPGSQDEVEDEDVIWDELVGSAGHYDAQITAEVPVTYESLDPSIATVDEDGFVSRVSDGNCRIHAQSARLKKQTTAVISSFVSTTVRTFVDWVAGSLGEHISDYVDNAITGLTPSVAKPTLSSYDTVNKLWTRNVNCWCADLDLTPVIIYQDMEANGYRYGGILIGSDIIAMMNHAHYTVGTTLYWVNNSNETISRTVTHVAERVGEADLCLCRLSSAIIPATHGIAIAKLINYSQFQDFLPQLTGGLTPSASLVVPTIFFDQEKKALIWDLYSIYNGSWGKDAAFKTPVNATRAGFYEILVGGDSGHPACLPINGELVLITQGASGNVINAQLASAIATAISGMGSAASISLVDLSDFNDYG